MTKDKSYQAVVRRVDVSCRKAKEMLSLWSKIPPPQRGRLVQAVGDKMSEHRKQLAAVIMLETGKTKEEAEGEVRSAIDMAYFIAGEGRRMYGDTTYSELPNRWALTKRYPIGVCAIIVPWNFPLSLMAWKVLPAILCGNTVVVKPSRHTPKTADLFKQILDASFIPDGVVNILYGDKEVGGELTENEHVRMVSFTGSTMSGRSIGETCARRLIKCSLELGGKNAVIVMEDADLDLAVDAVVKGAFSFAGQRCSATSRVIVHYSVYKTFLEKLYPAASRYPARKVINGEQFKYITEAIEDTMRTHTALCGGKWNEKTLTIEPTIFSNVSCEDEIAAIEVFGPVLCVFEARSLEHAIGIHNKSEYGLSASIFTRDIGNALSAVDRLEAGVVYVNGPTFGAEVHLPFGGVKQSGNGSREVGKAAIDTFSELKTIYLDYSGVLQNAQFRGKSR